MTYLFDGVFTHRDNTGVIQDIRPGEVNWMTSGSGVAHSRRTPEPERSQGHRIHGVQFWVGLPRADAEVAASFSHHGASDLPAWRSDDGRAWFRLIAGEGWQRRSPVPVYSRMFCVDVIFDADAQIDFPAEHAERAMHVVEGAIDIDGTALAVHAMVVLGAGLVVRVRSETGARIVLFGGDPLDGVPYVWWNFVAASRDRIERAKREWTQRSFAAVPGETEFIPLPER